MTIDRFEQLARELFCVTEENGHYYLWIGDGDPLIESNESESLLREAIDDALPAIAAALRRVADEENEACERAITAEICKQPCDHKVCFALLARSDEIAARRKERAKP